MRTESVKVEAVSILDAPKLDPILVIMQDIAPGRGRFVIECYGNSWAAYWGATDQETIRQFVTTCEAEYIAQKMWPVKQRRTKADLAYLLRIVEAVQQALRLQMSENEL